MKRDMDLARSILLEIESSDEAMGWGRMQPLHIEGYTREQISYNVMLLDEAGLIEAEDLTSRADGFLWVPERLTWAGHEFLDTARQEGRWQKAKDFVKEKTGGLSFDAIKAVLIKLMTEALTGG